MEVLLELADLDVDGDGEAVFDGADVPVLVSEASRVFVIFDEPETEEELLEVLVALVEEVVVVLDDIVLEAEDDLDTLGELEVVFDTVAEPLDVFVINEERVI